MTLPLRASPAPSSHARRSTRFLKEQQRRKGEAVVPGNLSGGIHFSEWLTLQQKPSPSAAPPASARLSEERPSPALPVSSAGPTEASRHDRRSLHRQATSQPDTISDATLPQATPASSSTARDTMAAVLLLAAGGGVDRIQSEPAAGIASAKAKYRDPLSWAPKAEAVGSGTHNGRPETADASAAAAMVDLGLRRASSQQSDHAASVVRSNPANPVGWTAAANAPPREAKRYASGGFGDIYTQRSAAGAVLQAGSQWDEHRDTVAAALVAADESGAGRGAGRGVPNGVPNGGGARGVAAEGTVADRTVPRRLIELSTSSSSEGAITIDQWLSAQGGSAQGGSGATSSRGGGPRSQRSPHGSVPRTPPGSQPHGSGAGGGESGGGGAERPLSERRRSRPFARVHSATDWVMFEGSSTPGLSLAAARVSAVDVSDRDEVGERAAGVLSGHVQSHINPLTWRAREAPATPPHAGGHEESRALHREETGLPRRRLPPNTSSPTRI